jgi:enamine deaminase RidA (YjgF/YER057c/UK114 family)
MTGKDGQVAQLLEQAPGAQTAPKVSLDDFLTGFIAGLAKSDVEVVMLQGRRFHAAVRSAFEALLQSASAAGTGVNFTVQLNAFHGDSPDINQAITRAVQRNIISLDNPYFVNMRLRIPAERAEAFLENLPGKPSMYVAAADRFLDEYAAVR